MVKICRSKEREGVRDKAIGMIDKALGKREERMGKR